MLQDVRYALRLFVKAPLFTATAVLTLALGVGANTAIFSVVNAVLVRALPFRQPDRLVQVAERNDRLNLPTFSASVLNYLSWKEESRSFDALGAIGFGNFAFAGDGNPEQIPGTTVTPSLMPILGLQPLAGRSFRDGDDAPGAPPVVMISQGLWRRRFGGDPGAIGRLVRVNGVSTQIVGVAPSALATMTSGDVWAPLTIDAAHERRLQHVITVVARLKPGVNVTQAQADMDSVSSHMVQQYPEIKDWGVRIVTFRDTFVNTQLRSALLVLLAAVACVLLIACANVASLLLARATSRQREIAVRIALGAGRARIVRQLLVESLVLSSSGGAVGLASAIWIVRVIDRSLPPNLLPISDVGIDGTVLAYTAAATLATGLLFGLAPAWHAARAGLNPLLAAAARSSTGAGRPRVRNTLVAIELALATMLLVGAALLGQTLFRLERVRLGFDPRHLLTFQLAPAASKYPSQDKSVAFYKELLADLKTVPGVDGVAASSALPFGNGAYTRTPVWAVGKSALPPETPVPIDWRAVNSDFFHTMNIPVLTGRAFIDADGVANPPVMIVSQSMARRFWGDDDPIGRVVHRVADNREFVVIGVAGDVRNITLNQELPTMYYSSAFRVWPTMDIAIRASGDASAVLAAVRQRLKAIDPDMPMSFVRPMDELVSANAAQPRLNAILLVVFAAVALTIAAIGVYGVLAYSVTQRTRELGLRMALGAEPRAVVALVVREGMTVGLIGLTAGLAGALALGRLLSALVFDVSTYDPATLAAVAGVLAVVALAASVLPARRAARVDPMVALRSD